LTASAGPRASGLNRVGQPVDFGFDSRLVDQRGLGKQITLVDRQGLTRLSEPEPFVVGQFEGQGLDFELGGVELLLGQHQFAAELFHFTATV